MEGCKCSPFAGTLFYDEEAFSFGDVWNLLYRENSPPSFYPVRPCNPGFYLIERSTAREEDRIADRCWRILITSIPSFLLCGVAGLRVAKVYLRKDSEEMDMLIQETMR